MLPEPSADIVGVLDRYGELTALVESTAMRPPADARLSTEVAPWILHEARLLDADRFETWLDGFTDDAVLWVPLESTSGPGDDQSLYLDDRRRLGERINWRRDDSAWGQQPSSTCTRVVGGIEAWAEPVTGTATERVVVRSSFTLAERRHHREQVLHGHQLHELVGRPYRCRTKILLVPSLGTGIRNPSFLM